MQIKCPNCNSLEIIKKGKRKNKLEVKQMYHCKDCKRHFILEKIKNKTYPVKAILDAVSFYNLGFTLQRTSQKINSKYKLKTPISLIHSWLKEFNDICSYHRLRNKLNKKYKANTMLIKNTFAHPQPCNYIYHRPKLKLINSYFNNLKSYLTTIKDKCPDDLFKIENLRCSQLPLNYNINLRKKKNYACKLAEIALEIAKNNKERHKIIENFMLVNDTVTLAIELPIYLYQKELNKFNLLKNITGNITGHIDLVQLKFGNIHILDYKPEADKTNAISQLFLYSLALSIRTNIFLRNFRCAWFDDKNYYEFTPADIILKTEQLSNFDLVRYKPNYKTTHYFTSLSRKRGGS